MKALLDEYREDLEQADDIRCRKLFEKLDKTILGDQSPPEVTTPLIKYLDALETYCNDDLLTPLFPNPGLKLLEEVCVELKAVEHESKLQLENACCLDDRGLKSGQSEGRGKSLRKYLECKNTRCWTLQSDPGSGKTTLLLHLAYTLCREAKAALEKNELLPFNYLPVFITINDWRNSRKDSVWQYLQDLVCNPFFLTMIGLITSQSNEERLFESPLRRSHLLERVEKLLLEGKPGHKRNPMPDLEISREVIDALSLKLLSDGGGPYPTERIKKLLLNDNQVGQLCRKWPGGGIDTNLWLLELANRTSLLLPQSHNHDRWRYLHRSIQEHMAARCLARHGRERWESLAASLKEGDEVRAKGEKSHLGQWAETFAYLAGEISNPNTLLKVLMVVNDGLCLRAMATADNVDQKTFEELLELTPGKDEWESRKSVILWIPERLDATDTAVRLLAEIRGGTKHGADLYFISEAYRAIAAKTADPDVKRLALENDRDLFKDTLSHLSKNELDEIAAALQKVTIGGKEVDLWCRIPAGEFPMGSPENEEGRFDWEPTNQTIDFSAYKMSAVPVTNAMYMYFDPSHKADRSFEDLVPDDERTEDHPVMNVTWYEAMMFCRWATEVLRRLGITGQVHLPSEAQWEYACRAGTRSRFWNGDKEEDLAKVSWYWKNSKGKTHPVGMKLANAWGLHDVHGNVYEWCEDTWHDDLSGSPTDGSSWIDTDSYLSAHRTHCTNRTRSSNPFLHPPTLHYDPELLRINLSLCE